VTRPRHALVIGKFYPPHAGHHLLLREAAARAHRVTVVVMGAAVETVPLADRVAWLRQVHAGDAGVTVTGIRCDIPVDLDSDPVWRAQVASMAAAVARVTDEPVDAVVSSEKYGDELAHRLGAVHLPVDPDRVAVPTSGTAVRDDLAGHWDDLDPVVRAGLAVRVVVLGAESTGTTTVSRLLAEHYRRRGGVWARTGWVAEYGREHTELKWAAARAAARASGSPEPALEDLVWTADDFATVAEEQTRREDAAAADGSPLLVCDNDAFAATVWERRYAGPRSTGARDAIGTRLPRHDVYLLTDHAGVPWVDDGLRDGEHVRAAMTGWFTEALTAAGHSWALLTGSLEERLDLAVRITDPLLALRATFARPLG
jgi:NadR type nicotinamide-nucleotide adenylyltransferase